MFHAITDTATLTVASANQSSSLDYLVTQAANNWFWTVMMVVAVCAIAFGAISTMVGNASRERTRREIAAYIAEGTMTPEQAEKLLDTQSKKCG